MKVDEVTDTVPPQDWAWQHFYHWWKRAHESPPLSLLETLLAANSYEGSSAIFISSVDIEK